jgi:hypothetical protein
LPQDNGLNLPVKVLTTAGAKDLKRPKKNMLILQHDNGMVSLEKNLATDIKDDSLIIASPQ